jgi:hypothetical protein
MFRKLLLALMAYQDAVRIAIQAYNQYIFLRHQSECNLARHGLRRDAVTTEIFRRHYANA